ncbi:MAG: hypothetical protein LBM60_07575 [Clostridium sp.]|jgi:spore coat polysaccharide biosynthesis predicted glycosyltransferase SpsG|nr:hypothetical protein [Clostridium sp.]
MDTTLQAMIRVELGPDVGMGHFYRMSVLAQALEKSGVKVRIFQAKDEPIPYDAADIIILDSYELSDAYIATKNASNRLVVCYDDNALYEYSCDVVANANAYAAELPYRFGARKPALCLGPQYALLREEFRECHPATIRENAHKVFVCFGGADIRGFSPIALRALLSIPMIEIHLVLGEMTRCDEEVASLASERVHLYKNPTKISEIMGQCDIAISAAGSSVYELASMGLPTILVVQADNQAKIAEYLSRHKLMTSVGDWTQFQEEALCQETKALLDDTARRMRESIALRQLVNKDGANKLAQELLRRFEIKMKEG